MKIRIISFMSLSLLLLSLVHFLSCNKLEQDVTTLKVSFSLSEDEWDLFRKKILPDFENKHKCKVEAVQVEASELPKLLEAGKMAQRATIDLFAQDNMQLAVLVKKELVEDFSEIQLPSKIYPSMIKAGIFKDKRLFVPFRPNVQIFYYNKAKFDKYGLRPPTTWYEWFHVAKTFYEKEKTGRILLKGFGGAPTVTQMYEYIIAAGGDPFSFNDKGCLQTFRFFQKLWKYTSPDSRKAKWDTSNDYLARDSVYLMQNWPFGYNVLINKYHKKNIKVYSGVKGPQKEAHVIGGDFFGIPVGSQNKKLAVTFIEYMISQQVQSIFVKELSWPSIREDAYQGGEDSPVLTAINNAMKHGVFRENVPYWTEFQKFFEEAFISVIMKGNAVEPTLQAYHDKMEKVKLKY